MTAPAREDHPEPLSPAAPRAGRAVTLDAVAAAVVLLVLAALFVARARQLSRININWDEFYFLSRIHEAARGELADALLTFHTRLFAWVPHVARGEIDQVIALRTVMALLAVPTTAAAFIVGRHLGGRHAPAALGALAGQALTFVVLHGCAARFDPPLVALCTTTLALLVIPRRGAVVAAAVCFALAFLVTLKAGLYVPTVLAFLLVGPTKRRRADVIAFVSVFAVVFGALLAVHKALLAAPPPVLVASDGRSASSMLARALPGGVLLDENALAVTLRTDERLWIALAVAVVVLVLVAGLSRARRRPALLASSLLVPILCALGYRNSFAYFYVSIFPAAAITIGVALAFVVDVLPRRRIVDVAAAVLVVGLALVFVQPASSMLSKQKNEVSVARALLAGVHKVFSKPVPYIDRCGMVASFPKVGPFMSSWGLESYRAAGRADLPALLSTKAPQFVLANAPSLRLDRAPDARSRYRLLPDDDAALRANFVPHWGPLWVAGHVVAVQGGGVASFAHRIPGRYRVEAPRAVVLDGALVVPGAVVELTEGEHTLAALDGAVTVTLRTALAGPPPTRPAPKRRLFQTLS
ncbi:MAG: hypothetical protein FJ137_19715, partial [Deltaproteobacteria bacterium]|nr:hypothetical protein [Deltaproteobacteria bacterium]